MRLASMLDLHLQNEILFMSLHFPSFWILLMRLSWIWNGTQTGLLMFLKSISSSIAFIKFMKPLKFIFKYYRLFIRRAEKIDSAWFVSFLEDDKWNYFSPNNQWTNKELTPGHTISFGSDLKLPIPNLNL
ncbi:hypothetical protein M3O96_14820 [Aquiflexum sp. TKW24L]|uniref:hypothetical protein n=1 Tax=Aquiflexum sp. TKW24L TaxID=2942212 RepID=UPI0020BD8EE6|nr:hypothetical protein [Aquiflexum sp. TKW24L]MCL6260373.1 hypothetical protein [Aquiflexum sp. TKW24L]